MTRFENVGSIYTGKGLAPAIFEPNLFPYKYSNIFKPSHPLLLLLLFSTYALQPSRLIVRSGLEVPTFVTRRLHVSPRESTQRRKAKL